GSYGSALRHVDVEVARKVVLLRVAEEAIAAGRHGEVLDGERRRGRLAVDPHLLAGEGRAHREEADRARGAEARPDLVGVLAEGTEAQVPALERERLVLLAELGERLAELAVVAGHVGRHLDAGAVVRCRVGKVFLGEGATAATERLLRLRL